MLGSVREHLHLEVVVDVDQVVVNQVIVGAIGVIQGHDVIKNALDVGDVAGGPGPELLARVLEVLGLDVAHLVDRVIPLLAPLELFIQKVQHREVEGPDVVPARQINIIVSVQTCERDRAPEVDLSPLG